MIDVRIRTACVIVALLAASVTTAGADTSAAAADSLEFVIETTAGEPLWGGELEFCAGEDCVFVELVSPDGRFGIAVADVDPDKAYTVIHYDERGRTAHALRGWRYVPSSWDRGRDPELGVDRMIISPTFTGTDDGQLIFSLNTEVNPAWQEMREVAVAEVVRAERDGMLAVAPPRLAFAWRVPLMLGGRFVADEGFAGGVESVKPGLSFGLDLLFGFADVTGAPAAGWSGYRVFELAYAGNRYETRQLLSPGELSDVTFHRLSLSFGTGWMSPTREWDLRLGISAAWGGIYDGDDVLAYGGRDYGLSGAGAYAQVRRSIVRGGGADVGLVVRGGYMHYPADAEDGDIWYGGAPSLAVGLVVF